MDLGLTGRNAIVLGGTRGIGRAIAGTLAGEGAGVAVCARNAEQVASTVAELQTLGARATGASVDITDDAALKTWITNVAREFGGAGRHRQLVWPDQSGADTLCQGASASVCQQENPCERRVSRDCLF